MICDSYWELIDIPSATFMMGSTLEEINECVNFWKDKLIKADFSEEDFRSWIMKEYPSYEVYVKSFKILKYPVTNRDYQAFCRATNHQPALSLLEGNPLDHPVWGVTVKDVQVFTNFLLKETGLTFRLPTEAEWEYAARGSSRLEYPYGNDFNPHAANTIEAGIYTTTPIHKYEQFSSAFGLVDMAGNVEEWVSDHYQPYPGGTLVVDHLVETLSCRYQILRGGFFAGGGDLSRSARRHGPFPSPDYKYIGFRLVCLD